MTTRASPKADPHRWYIAAGVVFVLGFIGCLLIDVLGGALGNLDLFGAIFYLSGPFPVFPAGLCAVGVFCQIADWWRERKRV